MSETCAYPGCCNNRIPAPGLSFCKDHRSEEKKVVNAAARAARKERREEISEINKANRACGVVIQAEARAYKSDTVPSDDEIRRLLVDGRELENLHVVETCLEWGKTTAEILGLTANEHYWLHGRAKLQESLEAGESRRLDPVSDEQAKGMIISMRDMFALYDYSPISWGKVKWPLDNFEEFRDLPWDFSAFIERKGQNITFEEFHGLRYCCIADTLWASRWPHEKEFQPKPHGAWRDFLPRKISSSPLPTDYSTKDIKAWLKGLADGPRRFFIAASRNTFKSTWQLYGEAIPFVLACPDMTILEVSAVKSLSKKFIRAFRKAWTVEDRRKPSLFAQLWPEMMIFSEDKSDSTNFQCPMAKGLYPQATMASSSVDASQVGERCLCLIFDDAADEENSATPDLREGLMEKIELIEKLREPLGITLIIGTPKAAEGDVYKVMLDRAAKTGYRYLNYRIDPAYILKPGVKKSPQEVLGEGTGDDIQEYCFPERLGPEELRAELSNSSEKVFRREYLCEWVDDDDPSLKLHFDRTILEGARIKAEEVPTGGDVFLTGDLGFSLSKYRDPSSFTVHKTVGDTLYVLTQSTGHWNDSGKAEEIGRIVQLYPGAFKKCILEKYPANEGLDKEIQQWAWRHGTTIPLFWLPTDPSAEAKFRRLKNSLELVVYNGKVKFVIPPAGSLNWIEDLIVELLKLDNTGPKRRSSTIRDDRGDSLSLAVKHFLPSQGDPHAEEFQKMRDEEQAQEQKRQQYNMIFGDSSGWFDHRKAADSEANSEIETPMSNQTSPIFRALSTDPRTKRSEKPLSFSYMNNRPTNN